MPTWIQPICQHFNYLTSGTGSATIDSLLDGAGWSRSHATAYASLDGPYTGDRALFITVNGRSIYRSMGANYSEVYLNAWAYLPSFVGGVPVLFDFRDASSTQIQIRYNTSGNIIIHNGTSALATSVLTISIGQWYHFQIKLVIHSSTGNCTVRINGVEYVTYTGDTQNTANAYVNVLSLYSDIANGHRFAALVGYSDSASWPLEERRYKTFLCDAAGNSAQFTPLSSTNVSNIDEQQPDGDTTYNSSTTPGNIDLFGTTASLVTGDTIDFALEESWIKKTDAGAREARNVLRTNSTNYESSSVTLTNSYVQCRNFRETNPDTASAWTPAEINALEVGYKDQA